MEAKKFSIAVPARNLPMIEETQRAKKKIADKLGVAVPTFEVTDRFLKTTEDFEVVEMAMIEFSDTALCFGGYRLLAKVDHAEGIVTSVPGAPEGLVARLSDSDNTCDHCGTRRARTTTYLIVDQEGNEKRVGSNCLRDFLGHASLSTAALGRIFQQLSDEEAFWMGCSSATGRTLVEWVAAAALAIRTDGYVPGSADYKCPTREFASAILYSREREGLPTVTAEDIAIAQKSIAYVLQTTEASDFALRLRQVAAITGYADKYAGTVVFIPEAYRRHLDAEAEKQAKEKNEIAPAPCPLGKIVLTGEVVGISFKDNYYQGGSIKKLIVLDDRGFKVYVTEPRSIYADRGDRVSMTVTIQGVSHTDSTFGFGTRPTKASVLAQATA